MGKALEYDEIIVSNGIKVPFVPEIITPRIERPMRNNRYEGGECLTVRKILRPGDRVLELGAGIGLISSVAAQVEGIAAVTAVEANPELIPVIRETHRLNGIRNVELLNGIVTANGQKSAPFYLRADFWASSMEPGPFRYRKKVDLPCFDIHDLIREREPAVIVCDIEGGELGLFDQADLSGVQALVIEFHPKVYGEEAVNEITRSLEARGLVFQKQKKPSTVRCFLRPERIPAAPTRRRREETSHPDLSGLQDRPWKPKSARFLVATCMKDEGPFIIEWLAWHKSIGIQDFVIFTNDCTDGTDQLLDRLEEMGQLRHLPNPALASGHTAFQPAALAYTSYLSEFRKADFFISMDVDEFINIRLGKGRMPDLLERTGPFDALSMSELNHGSNMVENFTPGLVTEQFPRHQRERPGKWKSRRGVKTIVRLGSKLKHIRNHRPDLRKDAGPVVWLDGSGRPLTSLHEDPSQNGIDVRGTYELVVLDHFALRSLESHMVKMFRGDVVVKGKMPSPRYWRLRDRQSDLTSTFERQQPAFRKAYDDLMQDRKLARLHRAACRAHKARIAKLLNQPLFQERRAWIKNNIWKGFLEEADAGK